MSSTDDTTSVSPLPYQVRVDQGHFLAAAVMLVLSLVAIAYAPALLFWAPILPAVFVIWILRSRTTFYEEGITARYLFKKSASVTWGEFKALRFTRGGKALAVRTDDTTFSLPGVSFNSLVILNEVTGGKIPDPVTPGLNALEDQVTVINRDSGIAVLMDKDEYEEYEATQRTSRMAREELERRDEARRSQTSDPVSNSSDDPQVAPDNTLDN